MLPQLLHTWGRFWPLSWSWKRLIVAFAVFFFLTVSVVVMGRGDGDGTAVLAAGQEPTPTTTTIQVTINDTSWVNIVGAVLTGLLVVGAFVAAFQVNRQIRQGEQQHAEQLKAMFRPLVTIPHAECRLTDGGRQVEFQAWLENVGTGPAINVNVLGWPRIPSTAANRIDEWRAEVDELRAEVDLDSPELIARAAALRAGDQPRGITLSPAAPVPVADYAARHGVILYMVTYSDAFDNHFPSKPRAEWKAGHIAVAPQGSWRR